VLQIERVYNLDQKTNTIIAGIIRIKGVAFKVELMAKMARFALNFGITTIGVSDPDRAGKITDGINTGIIMPMMIAEDAVSDTERRIYEF
jgi:hypothetical protein